MKSLFMFSFCLGTLALPVRGQSMPKRATVLERVDTTRDVVMPTWQNGYFISFDVPDGGPKQRIYVHDRAGKLVVNAPIDIPESVQTDLADAAISGEGEIAASGGARSADGKVSTFISWLDRNGGARLLVRTVPYTARRILFDDQGFLWALGFERDIAGKELPAYSVLRQYDRNGVVKKSLLPRSVFPEGAGAVSNARFAISGSDLIIYTPRGNEVLQVSLADGSVARMRGPSATSSGRIRSMVLTAASNIYISHRKADGGVGVCRSTQDGTVWDDVQALSGPVIGVDGGDLVVVKGPSLYWYPAE